MTPLLKRTLQQIAYFGLRDLDLKSPSQPREGWGLLTSILTNAMTMSGTDGVTRFLRHEASALIGLDSKFIGQLANWLEFNLVPSASKRHDDLNKWSKELVGRRALRRLIDVWIVEDEEQMSPPAPHNARSPRGSSRSTLWSRADSLIDSKIPKNTVTLLIAIFCASSYALGVRTNFPLREGWEGKNLMGRPCARAHRCVRLAQTKNLLNNVNLQWREQNAITP
ncbi:hypothetical protein EVAR_30914_1 [Eumeta japonica]|uniref:Uncharacterized protein n=1 Tax=Eumeta variegata TaxID=151549 RepID=A0A4C1V515_EUMVA|nr:hypothetical protein EVAR_30914_1 [Eumeta japonica]